MSSSDVKFNRQKLKNGLDLVLAPMPKSPTATAVVIFKTGSRHEEDRYSGISHFLEHMVFKGNKIYSNPQAVAAAIDELGGSFNAFTSREFTGFHIKVGAEFLPIALKWLGALSTLPLIPQTDTEMERNVILEEINMYNDTPMMQIEDIFERLIFAENSLGRSVIGDQKTLNRIKSPELKNYFNQNYSANKAVLVVAGNLEALEHKKKQFDPSDYFHFPQANKKEFFKKSFEKNSKKLSKEERVKTVYKKTDQTHLSLGTETFSYFDQRRYPLSIISTLMGGGMSFWAFSEIREKRGLAYYVHSSSRSYKDTGCFSIDAGLNNEKIELAIKEIKKLFRRICEKTLSPKELKKAKDHIIGSMALGRETSSDIAFLLGSEIATRGEFTPFSEEIKIIKKITAGDLKKVANEFLSPNRLRLAMIGPWKKKDGERFEKMLRG